MFNDYPSPHHTVLTQQLLEDPDASMMHYTELAQPYRYDPTSILENHS